VENSERQEFVSRLAVAKCDTVSKMGFVISTSTTTNEALFETDSRNSSPFVIWVLFRI